MEPGKRQFKKRCKSCGAKYDFATFTSLSLPSSGRDEDTVGGIPIVLRVCRCGSPLAALVSELYAPQDGPAS